jgi:hypothetical protein
MVMKAVEWFLGKFGVYLLVAGAVTLGLVAFYCWAASNGRAENQARWDAEKRATAAAAEKRNVDVIDIGRKEDAALIQALKLQVAANKRKNDAYLATRKPVACTLSRELLERLRER